jgi:hypothetical protein
MNIIKGTKAEAERDLPQIDIDERVLDSTTPGKNAGATRVVLRRSDPRLFKTRGFAIPLKGQKVTRGKLKPRPE